MESNPHHSRLQQLWQGGHRGQLHSLQCWNLEAAQETQGPRNTPSITYVSSGAGATGIAQLQRFFALFPAELHPFSHGQIDRFNNHHQVVSCSVDPSKRTVTEEIVVSLLHHQRWDYLVPGLEATQMTFAVPMVLVATYSKSCDLLEEVRIYWDQATLLKQLGVFPLVFHNLIQSSKNVATFENELAMLPILHGMNASRRLVHPTAQNCNQLVSLELLEAKNSQPASLANPPNYAPSNNCSSGLSLLFVVGGLDNITELAHQLPSLSSSSKASCNNSDNNNNNNNQTNNGRPLTHLASSVFNQNAVPDVHRPEIRMVFQAASSLRMGDGSTDPIIPLGRKPLSTNTVFGFGEGEDEKSSLAPQRPSIAIDPHRNESKLFKEEASASPFHPSRALLDSSRFESHIFAVDSPISSHRQQQSHEGCPCPVQLKSHIFDTEPISPPPPRTQKTVASACPFGRDGDEDVVGTQPPNNQRRVNTQQFNSHFHGSSLVFSEESTPPISFSGLHPDGRTNRSTISLAPEISDQAPPRAVDPRAASHNQSQIVFGDNVAKEDPPLPSSRVLQPPGGRSTIFLQG